MDLLQAEKKKQHTQACNGTFWLSNRHKLNCPFSFLRRNGYQQKVLKKTLILKVTNYTFVCEHAQEVYFFSNDVRNGTVQ